VASPVARWLTRSYLRWSTVWSLALGATFFWAFYFREGLAAAVTFGLLGGAAMAITFAYMRRWGRWRDRDPWDEP
jgi:O-antigen/teichoic acid export membrane protein